MDILLYIFVLFNAIVLSSLVSHFVPSFSVPLLQIILGMFMAFGPINLLDTQFTLSPDLFFILMLAPLIFYEGSRLNIRVMWQVKSPVLLAAVVFVIISAFVMGHLLTLLIPSLPFAIAFMLIAALGPTDSVAVAAVAKRVPIPKKLMSILVGESVMNDPTGITLFQFGLLAAMTGTFSVIEATGVFIMLWLGGLGTGFVLSIVKFLLVRLLRNQGIEDVIIHMIVSLMTPFAAFAIAEIFGFSGILAVLGAGITHYIMQENYYASAPDFLTTERSVWDMFAAILEGAVFVVLGSQIPAIITSVIQEETLLSLGQISLASVGILVFFALARYLWCFMFIHPRYYAETEGKSPTRRRASLLFSLSGARGTVTLASIMSIPLLIDVGVPFPHRQELTLIATAVIMASMLITNFLLPLFVEVDKEEESASTIHDDIINQVIEKLERTITQQNKQATEIILNHYVQKRLSKETQPLPRREQKALENQLVERGYQWKLENTHRLVSQGVVDEETAKHYMNRMEKIHRFKQKSILQRWGLLLFHAKTIFHIPHPEKDALLRDHNMVYVFNKLNSLANQDNIRAIQNVRGFYDFMSHIYHTLLSDTESVAKEDMNTAILMAVANRALSYEREFIHDAFEAGAISRDKARNMRQAVQEMKDTISMIDDQPTKKMGWFY